MTDLKIGGFRNNPSSSQDYELDFSTKDPVENNDPSTEHVEPVVTDPDTPVENPTEPVTPTEEIIPPVENPTEPVATEEIPVQIDDTTALTYLSEKLGYEVTSFDELSKPAEEFINPLDSDPYLKKIYEWREQTGRPIEDWIKFQRDYNTVSDLDVAREFLQYEYPSLDEDEIELELRKYISYEDDLDEDVAYKNLELKKYATKGRSTLSSLTSSLGEPESSVRYSQEVQENLEFAKQIKTRLEENQKQAQTYAEGIIGSASKVDSYKINLAEGLDLDFKISEESKKDLPSFIDTMPHWRNADGGWNHDAVVTDGIKIKHFDEIIRMAFEQGKNLGKDEMIQESKNVTPTQPNPASTENNGAKGVVIEGLDEYLGEKGMRLRFGKK